MRTRLPVTFFVLSLLSAVTALAVTSTAAEAKWTLLDGGKSVSTLALEVDVLPTELYVSGLELGIYCSTGSSSATLETFSESTLMSGEIAISFENCEVLENPFCAVQIEPISSSGLVHMLGEEVYALTTLTGFSGTVLIEGAFCTLPEETTLQGSLRLSILEPLKDLTTHSGHLEEELLTFGEEFADLRNKFGESTVETHVQSASSSTWAVHLTGL